MLKLKAKEVKIPTKEEKLQSLLDEKIRLESLIEGLDPNTYEGDFCVELKRLVNEKQAIERKIYFL